MDKQLALRGMSWKVLPYLYFSGLAAFWFFMQLYAGQGFSYVALGIILILLVQAIIQHKTVGIALGILGVVVNLFFFLAVYSEFSEFDVISAAAIELITVGSILFLSGLTMGVIITATNVMKLEK